MDVESIIFNIATSLPYPLLATDGNAEDPRIIYANQEFEAMTGYSLDELRGRNPNMMQGEKTDRAVIDHLKQCLRERSSFEGCTWNYRKNGEPYFLKWVITPFSADGREFFVAMQQELTQENTREDSQLAEEYVISLTRNLTAYYRNSLAVYQQLHQMLRNGDFDAMPQEEVIDSLQVRDSATLAASHLTEYLLRPMAS